jgi:hypothetical protein
MDLDNPAGSAYNNFNAELADVLDSYFRLNIFRVQSVNCCVIVFLAR